MISWLMAAPQNNDAIEREQMTIAMGAQNLILDWRTAAAGNGHT
jgi:hypothetical protein